LKVKMYNPKKEWKPRTLAITFETEEEFNMFKSICEAIEDVPEYVKKHKGNDYALCRRVSRKISDVLGGIG